MNKTTLYQLISPSGRRYVGITSNFEERVLQHLRTKHINLKNEFQEYSFDDFTVIKTEYNSRGKAREEETQLIRSYKDRGISLNGNGQPGIGIQISKDLKADVKIKCAKEGKTIREVVESLLIEWVRK